eukprot:TRINITY_DN10661_c0_g1_i1.p1 TRINITY_DN10661_c0_g1~~TRINITY_DN10661_c0_g1_i1.p1  ORF type:complete len:113 (+),score=34.28 TRINITY_DN10661_c0_g1_i1:3-341(+)
MLVSGRTLSPPAAAVSPPPAAHCCALSPPVPPPRSPVLRYRVEVPRTVASPLPPPPPPPPPRSSPPSLNTTPSASLAPSDGVHTCESGPAASAHGRTGAAALSAPPRVAPVR